MENVVKMLVGAPRRMESRPAAESANKPGDDFDKLLREKTKLSDKPEPADDGQALRETSGRVRDEAAGAESAKDQDAPAEKPVSQDTDEPMQILGQQPILNLMQTVLPYETMTVVPGNDAPVLSEGAVPADGAKAAEVYEALRPAEAGPSTAPVLEDGLGGGKPEGNPETAGILPQEMGGQKEARVQTVSAENAGNPEAGKTADVKPVQTAQKERGGNRTDQGTDQGFQAAAQEQKGEPVRSAENRQPGAFVRQTDTGRWQEDQPVRLQTEEAALPRDLGDILAPGLVQRKGELTVELEPASLGKLTIKVIYEAGRAAVTIAAANPRTLEMLNQRAGELAGILEEKTGQTTIVYTQAAQQDGGQYGAEQEGQGSRRDRHQESEQKRQESDNFAQQLRLGLV